MSEFTLYSYFRSSASYRVRIALHLKGIKFKYNPVHLLNEGGEQYRTEYKQLNPAAEVPTLVHDGYTLSQSMAIVEYLDQVQPEPRLIPLDPKKGGKVRQFCENINSGIQPLQNLKTVAYLEKEFGFTTEQKEKWMHHWMLLNLQTLESSLNGSGTYCFGGEVTAADVFLIPQLFAVKRFGVSLDSYPNIRRIEENCLKLEAFKKAYPLSQPDTPDDLKKS